MLIKGLNKAEVLAALYNSAKVVGFGQLDPNKDEVMTTEKAREYLASTESFDYVNGRLLKIGFLEDSNELDVSLYNRQHGEGAAEAALAPLFEKLRESRIVKPLTELAAKVVLTNKQRFFSSLYAIPAEVRDKFPQLEVHPMHLFCRKIKNLLSNCHFVVDSEEGKYTTRLLDALNANNPYNSIHPIIAELKTKLKQIFLSSFKTNMQPICAEVVKYMNEYNVDKANYASKCAPVTQPDSHTSTLRK